MRKGSILPLALVILVFTVVPLSFFILSKNSSDVMGTTNIKDFVGIIVEIETDGVWSLSGYLCDSPSDCLISLESGEKIKSIGGGKSSSSEVLINYTKKMDDYDYIKFYVKTVIGAETSSLSVEEFGGSTSASVHEVGNVEVVLIPLDGIRTGSYETIKFSDR